MTNEQKEEGLNFAEKTFLATDSHLNLDKDFITKHYDLTGKKVLDFGCGMGGMTLWLDKHYNCDIKGIDVDRNHIEICHLLRDKFKKTDIEFSVQDIVKKPLDEKFDYIFLNDVVEHIAPEYLQPIFNQLKHQLGHDGVIFVSYPPWEGPYASHLNTIFKVPWSQYWPKSIMHPMLKKRNTVLVGERNLMDEHFSLNHMNHNKLKNIVQNASLKMVNRMSHTFLRKLPGLKNTNFNFFPFKYLVTKELVVLRSV